MSGTMVFGYDVETASQNTVGFLAGATELHEKFGVPWTIYLTGQTVEKCAHAIRECMQSPLLTVAQHTYSHVLLKSVYMTPGDGKPVHGAFPSFFKEGGSLDQIREEIARAQDCYQGSAAGGLPWSDRSLGLLPGTGGSARHSAGPARQRDPVGAHQRARLPRLPADSLFRAAILLRRPGIPRDPGAGNPGLPGPFLLGTVRRSLPRRDLPGLSVRHGRGDGAGTAGSGTCAVTITGLRASTILRKSAGGLPT